MCCIIVLRLLGPLIKFQCSSMSICGAENFFLRPASERVLNLNRTCVLEDRWSGSASANFLNRTKSPVLRPQKFSLNRTGPDFLCPIYDLPTYPLLSNSVISYLILIPNPNSKILSKPSMTFDRKIIVMTSRYSA